MKKIEIALPDEVADQLAFIAAQYINVPNLLTYAVSQLAGDERLATWSDAESWRKLMSGETCPICPSIHDDEVTPDFGYVIAKLRISRFVLVSNQQVRGYCVLTCSKHVAELFELSAAERAMYFDDLAQAALAIQRVYQPIKLNYEILGNTVPHLHCHIKPRYVGDQVPHSPLIEVGKLTLSEQEYRDQVAQLREALR
ncbi:MAG: HIT family protein [Anaerolineae bacterium]|nr:HIT family protein [Anaerolineae bacterium]